MKHWQWFVALVGGIFLFEFIFVFTLFGSMDHNGEPDVEVFRSLLLLMPLMILYVMYFSYGWQWAIISLLRDRLPKESKFNHKRIKAFFVFPLVYMILIFIGMFVFMYFAFADIDATDRFFDNLEPNPAIVILPILIVPIHFFSIFCIFHSMYFAAKTIKAVELQREVTFNDFAAEFFLIWFNVIGIWILQPRLNKIANGENVDVRDNDIIDDIQPNDEEIV